MSALHNWWSGFEKSIAHLQYLYAFLAILLLIFLVDLVASCKIVKKTGNSGFFALLFYVPVLNILLWLALAFGEWPKRDA